MIIVADDLGADARRNSAVVSALEAGVVDAASVLVNGDGFAEAVERAAPFVERIGVHLVLTEGEPITERMRSLRRFCDGDGRFRPWRGQERAFRLHAVERAIVVAELRAQVETARRTGLRVTHLDSHHHVHTEPGLAGIVIDLARDLGIPRIRLARNAGAGMSAVNRAWKAVFNARLRRAELAGTRWFGGVDDYLHLRSRRGHVDSFEVMVHPVPGADGVVDDEHPDIPLALLLAR